MRLNLKLFFFLLLQTGGVTFASQLSVHYSVSMDVKNFGSKSYPLIVKATIHNQSQTNLDELVWMFYPNRYETILRGIDDVNLERVYIKGYRKGSLEIKNILVDGQQQPLDSVNPLDASKYRNIFLTQKLPNALQPGEKIEIDFTLVLNVPEKLGPFGWYRDQLTLSGGWSPMLVSFEGGEFFPEIQMPLANWKIQINKPKSYQLILPNQFNRKKMDFENHRHISLVIGKHRFFELQKENMQFVFFHQEKKTKRIESSFEKIANNFSEFVKDHFKDETKHFVLAQSPLREMLVVDGTPISMYSDRAFKVIKALDHFHAIPIYKSLFMQLFDREISSIEHERDLFWVQELVAWKLTEDLVDGLSIRLRDARDMGVMKWFKMFPLVDRVLYTPQFPFYDVFYNLVYPRDPVRDEVKRFSRSQPFGQTILAHMEDEVGKEEVANMIYQYLKEKPDQGFREFTSQYFDKDVEDRFEQWTSRRPPVNYSLGRHHRNKTGSTYRDLITIYQNTPSPLVEPVELKVTYKDKTSETQIWKSEESSHTFTFESDQKIKAIEIDPRSRLLETDKSDNRRPAYWKFVIMSMYVDYDIKEKEPLFLLQGQFRKRHGGLNRFDIGAYSQFNAYGANLGYIRLFGEPIDALRLSHGFRLGINFNKLIPDQAIVELEQGPTQIDVSDGGLATDVSLAYVFGNQLSYTNPIRGSYGGLTLRIGNPVLGSEFNYRILNFLIAGMVPIHPNHLWGMRFMIGSSGSDDIPTQLQYRLGGLTTMKGLSLTDDRFTGKHMMLVTNEYRHYLVLDMDFNMWLFRVRRIQGALFSNLGHVTDTVQERANQQAGLGNNISSFTDLFRLQDWQMDAGYGLRFYIDYLGVSPSLLSFDLARSVNEFDLGWRFYIGANHTF